MYFNFKLKRHSGLGWQKRLFWKNTTELILIQTESSVTQARQPRSQGIFAWEYLGKLGGKAFVKCSWLTKVMTEVAQEEGTEKCTFCYFHILWQRQSICFVHNLHDIRHQIYAIWWKLFLSKRATHCL